MLSPIKYVDAILILKDDEMLSYRILSGLRNHLQVVICQRNLGIFAPMFNKATDPIQQLFLEKIQEYNKKSGGGNKLVDPSPEIQKELTQELEKIAKQYGGSANANMTEFPSFKFTDPVLDSFEIEQK
ncbi:hypothetical protein FQA39_LY02670 [Lamprigera yunnana]|nr:hypothetical protein FQA39_LY02670 [Lamprigera yunnana]